MIWTLHLALITLPTSLYTQRLRDTKIWYDNAITASKLELSDPHLKDAPLLTWKLYRDSYLDACLMLNGRGQHHQHSTCSGSGCQQPNPTFCCCDCFGLSLYCKSCIANRVHHGYGFLDTVRFKTSLRTSNLVQN